ncbi:MAG: hypothetical protein QOC70_2299 [Verrucomicrobiota bacterium]|jgi:hypothetical protein
MARTPLLVGNAQAFWGDDPDAAARLVRQQPDLDFLTLDYLSEVSLSIMAIQREEDPACGYARDFVEVLRGLAPSWRDGSRVRIISNAGGLSPVACGRACVVALAELGLDRLKVAAVHGDDVLPIIKDSSDDQYANWETGAPISTVRDRLATANAYLGVDGIVTALRAGADIVVTGRVTDPSLTAAAAIAHFDWEPTDYDRVAGATVAGHLIECGRQVCGGFSTDWLELPHTAEIGFPVAEILEDGSCIITKPQLTGGSVNLRTVKEQLLYEIGDPENYISPDATVSLLGIRLEQLAQDRVLIEGAAGRPPTSQYKVSATYRDGYKAHAMITIFGRHAVQKARKCGDDILHQLKHAGFEFERSLVECLGSGACVSGVEIPDWSAELLETVLRVSVADPRREAVERFSKQIAPVVTAGPQGVTDYCASRPEVQAVFGYWPTLVDKDLVQQKFEMIAAEAA